jgi:4,5-DOPA dioxygenase extradiol
VAHCIQSGDLAALQDFQHWSDTGPDMARLAHPSHEHFLPLLYAAGAAHADEPVAFFNTNFQLASIGMRSVVWG